MMKMIGKFEDYCDKCGVYVPIMEAWTYHEYKILCTKCYKKIKQNEKGGVKMNNDQIDQLRYAISGLEADQLKKLQGMSNNELHNFFTAKEENKKRHIQHEFYKEAQEYREQERWGQIIKGSEKYVEPFNPMSWTPLQLLQHAMQENVDQGHYIYGLYKHMEQMERELKKYKLRCGDYEVKINQLEGMERRLQTEIENRDWEKNKADKLEQQRKEMNDYIQQLESLAAIHKENMKEIGKLTEFLVREFPEPGNAGQYSTEVAIDLLKEFKAWQQKG